MNDVKFSVSASVPAISVRPEHLPDMYGLPATDGWTSRLYCHYERNRNPYLHGTRWHEAWDLGWQHADIWMSKNTLP